MKYMLLALLLPMPVLAATMEEVNYQDSDPGSPAYTTRILVSKTHLRMDGGDDAGDFILLERRTGRVYNVMREDRRIFRYDARRVAPARPAPWAVEAHLEQLAGSTRKLALSVNGKPCMTITAAARLLPDTVAALVTYRESLAAIQAETWARTPPELRDECELAQHVWEIRRTLQYGLPIEEVYANGRSRHYVSHRTRPAQPALFRLPRQYQVVSGDMANAK